MKKLFGAFLAFAGSFAAAAEYSAVIDSDGAAIEWYEKEGVSKAYSGTDYATTSIEATYFYYYNGGSDRTIYRHSTFFEFDISDFDAALIDSVTLDFNVTSLYRDVDTVQHSLQHASSQSADFTGDAKTDKGRAGGYETIAQTYVDENPIVFGANSIDVTSYVLSDLANGYSFSAFYMPYFYTNNGDESNNGVVISLSSATLNAVPEPATCAAVLGALALALAVYRRRK